MQSSNSHRDTIFLKIKAQTKKNQFRFNARMAEI